MPLNSKKTVPIFDADRMLKLVDHDIFLLRAAAGDLSEDNLCVLFYSCVVDDPALTAIYLSAKCDSGFGVNHSSERAFTIQVVESQVKLIHSALLEYQRQFGRFMDQGPAEELQALIDMSDPAQPDLYPQVS